MTSYHQYSNICNAEKCIIILPPPTHDPPSPSLHVIQLVAGEVYTTDVLVVNQKPTTTATSVYKNLIEKQPFLHSSMLPSTVYDMRSVFSNYFMCGAFSASFHFKRPKFTVSKLIAKFYSGSKIILLVGWIWMDLAAPLNCSILLLSFWGAHETSEI